MKLDPDERYTTMTCGACGILNERHSNEEWTCKHCNAHHDRDPAAARCIFLKALAPLNESDEACGELQPTNIRRMMHSTTLSDGCVGGEDVQGLECGVDLIQ